MCILFTRSNSTEALTVCNIVQVFFLFFFISLYLVYCKSQKMDFVTTHPNSARQCFTIGSRQELVDIHFSVLLKKSQQTDSDLVRSVSLSA